MRILMPMLLCLGMRFLGLMAVLGLTAVLGLATGCKAGRPSASECKKAVENIRNLNGLDRADLGARPEAMVRSCRANATKGDAQCMIAAKTIDDLKKCEGETGAQFYDEEEEREKKLNEKLDKEDTEKAKKKDGDDE